MTFSDGHVSRFDPAFLAAEQTPDDRCEDAKELWATTEPPEGDWDRFLSDPGHRADCLDAVLRTGFTLLRGVPVTPGAVLEVAAGFGYVRETNYGKLFDVRVEATPNNLAFTGLPIAPHTDNPYRDPVPTVQLLHCLSNAVDGGESGLVDGFHAAALLREEDPAAFDLLARTPVTFQFSDTGTRADDHPAHDRSRPDRTHPRDQVQQPVDATSSSRARGDRSRSTRRTGPSPRS